MKVCEDDSTNGLTINVGPDEEFISINQLAEKIAGIVGFDLDPIYMPGRPQEVKDANCSAELARKLLGYKTSTNLDVGLRSLVSWIKEQGTKEFDYHLPIEIVNELTPKTWTEKLI
jgi:UDP-glucose 4-epimerase